MVRRLWNTVLDRAEALALDELPDADLVARFLADRAGPAFAAVVRRHGPLVWGVCRNLVPVEADAEDAFQATFLALAKGADRIRNPNALGAWLHGVAGRVCRTSLRVRAARSRRERAAAVPEANDPVSEDAWDRWQAAVHAEVDRLPKPLREAFVLCVLQGIRQPDAAARLGWSLGTVSARVCQAKKRLIAALGRRGVVGAAGLVALTGTGPVSAVLIRRATAVVAGGPVSEFVHQIALGAIGGVMGKTKLLAAGLLAAGLAVGSGLIPTAGGQVPAGTPTAPRVNTPAETPQPSEPGPTVGTPVPMRRGGPPAVASTTSPTPVKVEYKFVPTPADPNTTMDLMTRLGTEGWEYVGSLPGKADRLVFKQVVRGSASAWPTPALAPAAEPMRVPSRTGPAPSILPSKPRTELDPAVDGPTGADDVTNPAATNRVPDPSPSLRPEATAPVTGGRPIRPPTIDDPREPIPSAVDPDPAVVDTRPTSVLELAAGETVRHRMKTGAVIDRIKAGGSKVPMVEASPDPTDAKRVLIKAGSRAGTSTLLLTDANGVQEVYTIRVTGPTEGNVPGGN